MKDPVETLATHSHHWQGPNFTISVANGASAVCAFAGYRRELSAWEGRLPSAEQVAFKGTNAAVLGDAALLTRPGAAWSSFELEIIVGADTPPALVNELLAFCIGEDAARGLAELPEVGSIPISANQDLPVPESWRADSIVAVDLRISALPTRRRVRGAPVVFGSRWLRLVVHPRGLIALWYPVDGHWPAEAVRWPHHCIPSRDAAWVASGCVDAQVSGKDRVLHFLGDLFRHEIYFASSWALELELWEERLFGQLADDKSELFEGIEFPDLQRELGHLADYLAAARFDQRNFTRRADESRALSDPDIRAAVSGPATELGSIIDGHRGLLRQAFALLANAATGEQFYASRQQQRITERLQGLVTFVTAILLVPTLVAAIYGTNISELSFDGRGGLASLVGAMTLGALVSLTGLRWYQRKPLIGRGVPAAVFVLLLSLAALGGTALWSLVSGPTIEAGIAVAGSILVLVHALVWLLFMRPKSRDRQ